MSLYTDINQVLEETTDRMREEQTDNREWESRITDLLARMTLEEKVGQMTQITHSVLLEEVILNSDGSPGDDFSLEPENVATFVRDYKVGSFLNGIAVSPAEWYEYSRTIQEVNLEHSRLGIPLIYGIDHMHGASYVENSTIFPHRMNLGATFDTAFSASEARILGIESADLGHHWIFAPVLDVGRNPYFPRFYETYGEDPLLCTEMGRAFIAALENNPDIAPYKQAACAKHFIGYSDPRSGWDRSPAELSDQTLQEFFMPSFAAAVKAGVKTFMINGGEINGVPVHASYRLLTEVLRNQLGFTGVAVTDWEDVIRLHTVHKVVASEKEATYLAIMSGIDMSMTPFTTDFVFHLRELVEEGRIPMERIDLSVSRILRLKCELGLFEEPFPRNDRFDRIKTPEHRAAALKAAQESLVLLKNEELLPLSVASTPRLVVTGKTSNMKRALAGGWTLRWIPATDEIFPEDMHTVYTALAETFERASVKWVEPVEIGDAAKEADVLVVAVGEEPYSEGSGNIRDLTLEEEQLDLVRAAQATGKPVILVVIAGRPRLITSVYEGCSAVIWAGLPGFEGGQAIADLIAGNFNPSGKMPFSYPAWAGHYFPYSHKLMDLNHYLELTDTETHLVPFGHGLSYTQFTYSDLEVNEIAPFVASVRLQNTGDKTGKESVLWFLTDEIASITRPVKLLKRFEKVELGPGESCTLTFAIDPMEHLSFPNETGERLLEAGQFTLRVADLETDFEYVPE